MERKTARRNIKKHKLLFIKQKVINNTFSFFFKIIASDVEKK